MNKQLALLVVLLIALVGLYLWSVRAIAPASSASQTSASSGDMGTYPYECDEHVAFTMTPASDMSTITLAPVGSGTYPPAVTLIRQSASSGVRYEGGGVLFTAHGETVVLGEGNSAISCSPVPNQQEAPFNFGD